jgi:outer membrane protein TolC
MALQGVRIFVLISALPFGSVLGPLLGPLTPAAGILGAQNALDAYVAEGLEHNLGMRRQRLALRGSEAAVREARGNYLPSATVNARYTDVRGQVLDLGQFINPAYAALNQLLGAPQFPTDIDVRLPFKQETGVRIAQPIFQPQIIAGHRAARAVRDATEAARDAAARDLVAAIRTSYIQHARARRLAELRAATRALVEEQQRVVARLLDAGRATPDALSRVRAEVSEAVQREAEAAQLVEAASQHFNLLIGRALTDSIVPMPDSALEPGALPALDEALARGRTREELRAVSSARRAAVAQQRAAQGSFLPTLAVALDYGVQGNEYRFSRDADFTTVSVLASWNLFNGGRDGARVQQARLAAEQLALAGEETERGVELQVRLAWQGAVVARAAIGSAGDQLAAAARTHELVRRRFEEGLASPLELSEARVQLTAAALNEVFTRFDYYVRRVELDRAAALSEEIR